MTTIRERQEEKRREKLEHIRRQVADGSLVIRQMTAEERRHSEAAQAKRRRGQPA
jgi:hypothetical protein